jgi:hypothetical protein
LAARIAREVLVDEALPPAAGAMPVSGVYAGITALC